MTKMTIFEIQSKEGMSEKLVSFFKSILPGTRDFPGNKGTEFSRLSDNKFIIVTYWQHESDLGHYLNWRENTGEFSLLLSFLIQAPNIVTYEALEDI
ncbi:putative quinol monooxygenase [Shewanella sp. YLB-07]|uniref:putative quinol monooxygenase n=1 Tax=Shewanella sp. YLB-07 TaxID=2601268 RepID=UPI001D152027|nr:antibiotic biosynthesis monooxygenase [Shewanella sp. YLB-07]